MLKSLKILQNQRGSIMLIALLMMALLTIIGISALDISEIEQKVASNDRIVKKNFYLAEASALEAASRLESLPSDEIAPDTATPPAWLNLDSDFDAANLANWVVGDADPANDTAAVADIDSRTRFSVVYEGIAAGGSLDMSASQVHQYGVFGLYDDPTGAFRGQSLVEVGYRRRF
ncbi:PilX N-terminal domain-containing pilus assembly protein [Desulfuromonas sp. KJ2020]|uniref:PilX N-terminal domain-containing pilus assembly protein n=1 Tax=Desulfuromonas sp. KJ2020 TaxID=2919173 RepID=UPI0020A7EE54|nr:PilX N-terminal domain-containing pilus assembly protein [Desulfuromonas sp. KJ2020]MCP3177382.1 PilX N-terminal domain-containing pilus assembly protein [Desulfuromonas sp. KJ2020]